MAASESTFDPLRYAQKDVESAKCLYVFYRLKHAILRMEPHLVGSKQRLEIALSGSCCNGLALCTAFDTDLDLTLSVNGESAHGCVEETMLSAVLGNAGVGGFFVQPSINRPLPWSQPVFRGEHDGLRIDVALVSSGVRFNCFIRALVDAYPQLRRALLFIKQFAKTRNIYGSQQQACSSGYLVFFLSYLQQRHEFPVYLVMEESLERRTHEEAWPRGATLNSWRRMVEEFAQLLLMFNFERYVPIVYDNVITKTLAEFRSKIAWKERIEKDAWAAGYEDALGFIWLPDPVTGQNQASRTTSSSLQRIRYYFKQLIISFDTCVEEVVRRAEW